MSSMSCVITNTLTPRAQRDRSISATSRMWRKSSPLVGSSKTSSSRPLASAEAYLPGVMLQYPLPGKPAVETSAYGTRIDPVQGKTQEFHTGADLSAVQGTPVYAAASGVVRIARNHASYGNYVRLLHPGGDETIYAHLQYLFVRQGQQIQAGQCLGTVGQTGNATGPHLHFELLHAGVRYDPTRALAKAGLQAEP